MGMSSVTTSPGFQVRRTSKYGWPGVTSCCAPSATVSVAFGHQRGMRSRRGNSIGCEGVTTIFTEPDEG